MKIRLGRAHGLVILLACLALASSQASADTGNDGTVQPIGESSSGISTPNDSSDWMDDYVVTPAVSAGVALMDSVYLHAFGGWAFGITLNENNYLTGNQEGKWDNVDGGVVIGSRPHERLRIHSQIGFDNSGVFLDYLFAEVSIVDEFNARAGRFSQPFGLYSEILEIGTLRPLYALPTSVYRDAGFTATSVTGATFTGTFDFAADWLLRYDVYGGQGRVIEGLASIESLGSLEGAPDRIEIMAGGRIQVETPVDGLLFGLAGYWGEHEGMFIPVGPGSLLLGVDPVNHGVLGGQIQYLTEKIDLRTEYYHQWEDSNHESDVFYFEGAYRFLPWLQAAARFDYLKTDLFLELPPLPGFTVTPSVLDHKDLTVGLNFWMRSNFVLKLNYTHVWGNRFALPENAQINGDFIEDTDLFQFGIQFSF